MGGRVHRVLFFQPGRRSVDAERVRDVLDERLQGDDPDNPKEQGPE